MAAADYRLLTEATGQRIATALEALVNLGDPVTITHGGTGATTAAAALAALGGVAVTDIVNNLTNTATDKVLAAGQGKALNDKIDSMLSGVSFITFQTANNSSVTLNLDNSFRGLLFCTSAYGSNVGIINITVNNSGGGSAGAIVGASEITINTSVNNKITVSSTQWTICFLMSTGGASIAS